MGIGVRSVLGPKCTDTPITLSQYIQFALTTVYMNVEHHLTNDLDRHIVFVLHNIHETRIMIT